MTRLATLALAAAITFGSLVALAVADPGDIIGTAIVTDGDTVRVGEARVRLFAIDAPEKAQTCFDAQARSYACGRAAAEALRFMLAADPVVTCERKATDRYGRVVAVCSNGGGDLGARLVAQGWAVIYERYGGAVYRDQQSAAQAERLGLWSGEFQNPAEWRRNR